MSGEPRFRERVSRSSGGTVGAWLFGLFLNCLLLARFSPGQTRALIFHRDGRTTAPHGFAHYNSKFREVTGTNANIVSIEARGYPAADADVVMYSWEGDVAYLAGHLHRDNAHKVAVRRPSPSRSCARALYIYGSRARGDERPESDLDMFVDLTPRALALQNSSSSKTYCRGNWA